MRRWMFLKNLAALGGIKNLRRQVRYDLVVNGVKVSVFTADFVYNTLDDVEVVEDVKPASDYVKNRDRSYGIRKRLMLALFNVVIQEV